MDPKKKIELEQVLEERLHDGALADGQEVDVEEEARERITAPYEYRIRADRDPIAEETKMIRKLAKEPDGKYDRYSGKSDV